MKSLRSAGRSVSALVTPLCCCNIQTAPGSTPSSRRLQKRASGLWVCQPLPSTKGSTGQGFVYFYSPFYHSPLRRYWRTVGAQLTLAAGRQADSSNVISGVTPTSCVFSSKSPSSCLLSIPLWGNTLLQAHRGLDGLAVSLPFGWARAVGLAHLMCGEWSGCS